MLQNPAVFPLEGETLRGYYRKFGDDLTRKDDESFDKSLQVTALEIQSICSFLQVPFPEWNFIIKIKTLQEEKMENLLPQSFLRPNGKQAKRSWKTDAPSDASLELQLPDPKAS